MFLSFAIDLAGRVRFANIRMLQRTLSSFSRDRHGGPCNRRALIFYRAAGEHFDIGGGCMYTLYSMRRSGNCYKVRLALAQLDIAA